MTAYIIIRYGSSNTTTTESHYDTYYDCNDTFYIQPIYTNEWVQHEVFIKTIKERNFNQQAPRKLSGRSAQPRKNKITIKQPPARRGFRRGQRN